MSKTSKNLFQCIVGAVLKKEYCPTIVNSFSIASLRECVYCILIAALWLLQRSDFHSEKLDPIMSFYQMTISADKSPKPNILVDLLGSLHW